MSATLSVSAENLTNDPVKERPAVHWKALCLCDPIVDVRRPKIMFPQITAPIGTMKLVECNEHLCPAPFMRSAGVEKRNLAKFP